MMRTKSASFAWDMLRSDGKLLAYPFIRIAAGFALFAGMWTLIFDISAMEVGRDLEAVGQSLAASSNEPNTTDENAVIPQASSLMDHTNFGWLLLFFVINAFIGVFSVGALSGQAIAIARGENRGVGYGYSMALLRSPQLIGWWIVTVVVGLILSIIESQRLIGLIVAMLLGAAWAVLSFFSVTAIMATGCGPFAAIGQSKTTIVDSFKKIGTNMSASELKKVRRGVRVGGPLLIINLVLFVLMAGMIYFDVRSLHQGGHGVSAGAFGALVLVMILNGAFGAALNAIFKSVVWVWAREGTVPASVDATQLEGVFVTPSMKMA